MTPTALALMSRKLQLLSISCDLNHPDVVATLIDVAKMYVSSGDVDKALKYWYKALKMNISLFGENHIQTYDCYHAIALAHHYKDNFALCKQNKELSHKILVKLLEEGDTSVLDSQNLVDRLSQFLIFPETKRTVQAANANQVILDTFKGYPDIVCAIEHAIKTENEAKAKSTDASASVVQKSRDWKIDEQAAKAASGKIDKRAARAASGKIDAKQTSTPLTELLDIINSKSSPETETITSEEPKNEKNKSKASKHGGSVRRLLN